VTTLVISPVPYVISSEFLALGKLYIFENVVEYPIRKRVFLFSQQLAWRPSWIFQNGDLLTFLLTHRLPVPTMWVNPPPWGFVAIFPKRLGIFRLNFTRLLCVPRLRIQLTANLTKLCYIKRDHPIHIMCAKCPPSAETHAGIFWHFFQTGIFSLLNVHIYARIQIVIKLYSTVTKSCHIKCDHPACVSVDGVHFEHIMVVALNMA